jgi:hypothetical protein
MGAALFLGVALALDSAETSRILPIPDRPQDAASPSTGWCGETAIQEAMLHVGMWASQRRINAAGKPAHPDLYSNEIPAALAALGVPFTAYSPKTRGFAALHAWMGEAIDHGEPVFAGVKLLPSEHPEWGLDHFVLVVGHGPRGLLVNTTWDSQRWVGEDAREGPSFANAFFALRLRGPGGPSGAPRARLTVTKESADEVSLHVECTGLVPGGRYRVERRASAKTEPTWSESFAAPSGWAEWEQTVNAREPAQYRCVDAT